MFDVRCRKFGSRWAWIMVVALAWYLALIGTIAQARELRIALVVANGDYAGFQTLSHTYADGDSVASALASVGFVDSNGAPVKARRDLTRQDLASALAAFGEKLAMAGPDAFGVVYFSGHGAALSSYGDVVMLPVDAGDDYGTLAQQLSRAAVTQGLLKAGPRTLLVVLDMCRDVAPAAAMAKTSGANLYPVTDTDGSNPALGTSKGPTRLSRQSELVKHGQGFLVAFSTSPDQAAFDTGEFSKVLAEEIRRPGQNIADALKRVSDRVAFDSGTSGPFQKPTFDYGLQGAPPCFVSCNPQSDGDQFYDCASCSYMRVIPAGEALVGSPLSEPGRDPDEPTPHLVKISKPFAIGVYPVTVAEWRACVRDRFCPARPDWTKENPNPMIPATHISYRDGQKFLAWISTESGKAYRLASDDEWEYAARSGATTAFAFGDDIQPSLANYDHTASYRRSPTAPYRGYPEVVNGYPPNGFGLFQMEGNVWQWSTGCQNPTCAKRTVRGGSFQSTPRELRLANRFYLPPDKRRDDVGLRVARDLDPDEGS